jgi:F-type H+-transporting ATPase subunit alpha
LSVSRVGGAAQPKVIKKIAGSLRLDLAQYRELAAFSQFSSDLDAETQARLTRGRLLTEILKQPQYSPLSVWEQAISIIASTEGAFDGVPIEKVKAAQEALLTTVEQHHKKLINQLGEEGEITDDAKKEVINVASQVAKQYKTKEQQD